MATSPVTHHTIAIHQVTQTLLGARHQGLDCERLLRRSGIAPELLESPLARVSQAQYASLLRQLQRATRDEFWGLLNRPLPIGSFAQCCRLLVHTQTLGEAMRVGFRFYHPLLQDFLPRLRVQHDVAEMVLVPGPGGHHAGDPRLVYAERSFVFLSYGLLSWLVARRLPLIHLSTQALPPGPGGASDTYRLFQAPMHYGQGQGGLRFEARWLELPVVQNSQSLADFLRRAPADLVVRYRDQTTVTERIRRLLRGRLQGELPSLESVGQALAMTPQTLRRRLREEGQGFQSLKDDLRRDAAIEYLGRAELTLVDIAARLGFSEASTFHRAFKKWTGVAPGEYRQFSEGVQR